VWVTCINGGLVPLFSSTFLYAVLFLSLTLYRVKSEQISLDGLLLFSAVGFVELSRKFILSFFLFMHEKMATWLASQKWTSLACQLSNSNLFFFSFLLKFKFYKSLSNSPILVWIYLQFFFFFSIVLEIYFLQGGPINFK
jgi:hypothetical protein